MARVSEAERVKTDLRRLADSSKNVYEPWEKEYACDLLEKFYYGNQWEGDEEEIQRRKYVINLFYSGITTSLPAILFNNPKFKVVPRPSRMDDPLSDVEARARLQEETVNSFIQDRRLGFKEEISAALLDAHFRFGLIEVGYTADYVDNPNAGRPMLTDSLDENGERIPMTDRSGQPVLEANATIDSEGLYFKWIPAKQFRTSIRNSIRFEDCDWVAYYEWHHVDDLKRNKAYKNTSNLQATGRMKAGRATTEEKDQHPGMVKVWRIWDLRSKTRRVLTEGGEKYLQEKPFSFLPIVDLRFHHVLGQWLPLPLTYNWVHPQNQLNDGREMRRLHRKRAIRRYLRRMGAFSSEEEFAKLLEDDDMTTVEVTGDPTTALVPVQDASLDPAIFRDMADHLSDFTRVSGISGEAQQVAASETATQANLIALSGRIRESMKRQDVADWLSRIARVVLLTLHDNMALPFWIKKAVDPSSPLASEEAMEVAQLWSQITGTELGDIDNEIMVDLTSMSPTAQAEERTDWLSFLGLVTNPQLGMVLSASPSLMRKTAGLFNIHSEREIAEVAKALQVSAMMQAQAQMAQQAKPSAGGGIAAPGPTPTNAGIGDQLAQQLPVEMTQ